MTTTAPKFSPEDPLLTAYALGELDEPERAEIEARLHDDPAAQATVVSIRATAAQLKAALAAEPLPEAKSAAADPYRRSRDRKLLRFPRFYYIAATLAAACFAVLVVVYPPKPNPAPPYETRIVELNLPPAPVADASMAPGAASTDELTQVDEMKQRAKAEVLWNTLRQDAEAKLKKEHAARGQMVANYSASQITFGASARTLAAVAAPPPPNTESYAYQPESGFVRVADHPLSTFAVDVDTASYANVRRFIESGERPPVDAVRIEELLNYFPYHYAPPADDRPFAASMEVAAAPWAPEHRLVRIGLQGREITLAARPAANLVFLLDVSGSMNAANKLPLVKTALRLLVERLRPDDRVAIVTYAGAAGLALPSTPARRAAEILRALDALRPEGSTNGAMGIHLAYDIARANFVKDGINRVILCTDGDFNVGATSEGELTRLIGEKAGAGVFLSVLGFGMGNYKDATLEKLADRGNGNYGYIDSKREAEKLLVEQVNGTLVTIAKDVKLQVEFNPAQVGAYRLIGYENRRLQKEDFDNDAVDAGEIGAGHAVTALYEIVPAGGQVASPQVAPLKYQPARIPALEFHPPYANELLTLKVRYKTPDGDTSRLLEFPLTDRDATFAAASSDFKFAAAVAGFGMLLRDSAFKGSTTLPEVETWARAGLGADAGGYRHEFLGLIAKVRAAPLLP